ncbi:putative PMR5 domain, PC-Esterase [Helianthus annuus]|uniref:PMR5 domain, PC-Esterase n=1 Tax=Helianthus annuus TaxID=4232 RepID=A0A251TG15_HELAN|nr:protein trichome birefringence-like 19 [Helianthus annuus]KAF5779429.1 putative PMR5 domain, PC-Esterase [Helianthus annuus]KAJ0490685.1 putative PMR5 domain, PC-Esterase [Helianthus annuus]KAJ0494979.1 putative PMR5 domain, PC-Esterase [Helianthus annuus]KAJ0506606.1 putative PMR5 domain, PC-Esterase [Helianthus annuus]KAJ0676280.1 putative PMR5 domain, PC-Esterase [Helianthus annuus]
MKFHAINESKTQILTRRSTTYSKILVHLIALTLIITILPIYYPYIHYILEKTTSITSPSDRVHVQTATTLSHHHPLYRPTTLEKENDQKVVMHEGRGRREGVLRRSGGSGNKSCDLFSGEWVESLEGSYYTNETCWAIQEHQNCLKFGRPDRGFLKWRWKPYSCELPVFDPVEFLEMVRGKSLAFVGDSVARNHMQSLVCLLSRVAYPNDVSNSSDLNFKRYEYPEYNFTISIFWSPYLVNTERTDGQDITQPFKLYLDEFDESWTSQIENFNYVIISAGQWFFRPTIFYSDRHVIGCLYCPETSIRHRSSTFSYRRAWRTAFRAIYSLKNFKGIVFLRSFVPSHFEGGPWDKGGDCVRTKPLKSNESVMEDYNVEMYKTQLQEYKYGEREGRKKGVKITLMDMTQIMQLRPDGHPSKYGHLPLQNVTMANDCVHWCLPGPIDSWNDFLMELMIREECRR